MQWNASDQNIAIAVFETSHSCFQNSREMNLTFFIKIFTKLLTMSMPW
jgi:hypothetical protein